MSISVALATVACATVPVTTSRPRACVYTQNSIDKLHQVESRVGTQFNCVLLFSNANPTWTDVENPWFFNDGQPQYDWSGWLRKTPNAQVILTFGIKPSVAPSSWRADGARGDYSQHWRQLAKNLVTAGAANAIIRLAPEMNGDWNVDNVGSTLAQMTDWKNYWRQIVGVMRAVRGSHFRFDWNVNSGYRAIDPNNFYPGDDVVDIIGVDQYDMLSNGVTPGLASWNEMLQQSMGLNMMSVFAQVHHKKLSVPEWGLISKSTDGAGDDAYYVNAMMSYFAKTGSNLAYQSLWYSPSSYSVDLLKNAPNSLTVYRLMLPTVMR